MRKYDYGSLHFLRAEDKEELLRLAEGAESYEDFRDGCGWMDWMEDFCDSPDGGELSEQEVKRIEDVQREAWEKVRG
jgi:hypothetical protein